MTREALLESEQLFRAVIEHSTDAIILLSPQSTIVYASPSTVQVTGYTPEEIVGMKSCALLHPDDLENQLVVTQRVRLSAGRALGYWDEIAGVIDRWTAEADQQTRDFLQRVSVRVDWPED